MGRCFARRRAYAARNDANNHIDLSANSTHLYTQHNFLHDIPANETRFNKIRLSEHHSGPSVRNGDERSSIRWDSTVHLQQSVIFCSTKFFGLVSFWRNAEFRRKPPLQKLSSSLLLHQKQRTVVLYIKLQFCLFSCTKWNLFLRWNVRKEES